MSCLFPCQASDPAAVAPPCVSSLQLLITGDMSTVTFVHWLRLHSTPEPHHWMRLFGAPLPCCRADWPLSSPQGCLVSIRYGWGDRRSPRGEAEAGEKLPDCVRWIYRGKYSHPCATARTSENIKFEYPGHQLSPRVISRPAVAPLPRLA